MTAASSSAKMEEPVNRPVKFLFDDEFGKDGSRINRARLTAAEHDAGIIKAEEEGYRRGFTAAETEMKTAAELRIAVAAEKVADAMSEISAQLAALESRVEAEAVEVALSVSRKLAPALIAREPLAEIEQLVIEVLAQVRSAPHVVVRIGDDLIESASARLLKLAEERGYSGRLILLPQPDLAADSCRIEWADGGVIHDRAAIEDRITEAVARYLGRTAKSTTTSDSETIR
jgi:flagellar assembly protein FliH